MTDGAVSAGRRQGEVPLVGHFSKMSADEVFTCPVCGAVLDSVIWDPYGECWYWDKEDGEYPVMLIDGKVMSFRHGGQKYGNDEYVVLHGH